MQPGNIQRQLLPYRLIADFLSYPVSSRPGCTSYDVYIFFGTCLLCLDNFSQPFLHLDIKISDRVVSYLVADGVVVATPTGSTAYALSAGGPILAPQIDAMSFVAIAPHSLTFRPLVIPKEDNIELSLAKTNLKAMLTIDGYDICEVDSDTIIKTQISNKYCYIFQSSNRLFYDILRYKLNWGR